MRRRSNLLVLLGLASFVLGLVAVYLITDDDDGGSSGSDEAEVAVLVAAQDLVAGALGDDVVNADQVRIEQVPLDERAGDALTSFSQLSGTRLTASFVEGEQLRAPGIQSLGGARPEIPDGYEALAVQIGFVDGGANTIIPGDRVNVYVNQASTQQTEPDPQAGIVQQGARVQLLLTNTLVLDVTQGDPNLLISSAADGTAPSTPSGLTVVLAVNAIDAEKLIFGSDTVGNSLYLSRLPVDGEGNPPPPAAGSPSGRTLFDILAEAAADAASRNS